MYGAVQEDQEQGDEEGVEGDKNVNGNSSTEFEVIKKLRRKENF